MISPYEIGKNPECEALDRNVQAALETAETLDRLTALRHAHRVDLVNGTQYAPQVVAAFAEQRGLDFVDNTRHRHDVDTSVREAPEANLIIELARAVGARFAVETVVLELVCPEKQSFVLSYPGDGGVYLNSIADSQEYFRATTPQNKAILLPVKEERPYVVMQKFLADNSRYNFSRAMLGLKGFES